jgi:hypothetical protein
MDGPLIWAHLSQVGAFTEADAGGAHEQERITKQIVGSTQFLLQALIVLEGERPWQITGSGREIFTTNKVRPKGMEVGGQILQQSSETKEMLQPDFVAQGRLSFAQPAEPAEQMGIAAQLRESGHVWKRGLEIGEEVACRAPIVGHRAGPQGGGERLEMSFKDAFELGSTLTHERCEESNAFRFSMARAYSRQTSCGASWT